MFNSIAYAADGAAQGSPVTAFLPLIIIFAIFYVFLIRPQQKKQKELTSMLNSISAGDEILTTGGLFGKVTKVVDNNTFVVEIANGVSVKVAKSGVAQKVIAQAPAEEKK